MPDPTVIDADEVGSHWWRLFNNKQHELQLWSCLRAWRFVALRKKRRFVQLTAQELLEIEVMEDDIPLHAVVVFITATDASARDRRFEWIQHIVQEFPQAAHKQDRRRWVALHHAFTQTWEDHEQLHWLLAKSQSALLTKDGEGRSLTTHAVLHGCPQGILMLIAVELARMTLVSLEELVRGRQFESARRLCVRMVEEYFAGVPHFPHAFCLHLLRQSSDVLAIIGGMQRVWLEFIDKWGYYGTPMIQDDLPTIRHAPLDSFLQLTITANGEPLHYQWFVDDEPIASATHATLFISQCVQHHNEGVYYCQVTNWKGRVDSCQMKLLVVDDKNGPDPSLRFLLSENDKATLTPFDAVHWISGSRGGLIHALLPPWPSSSSSQSSLSAPPLGACMEGCSLLLPPNCFQSFTKDGVDVSDSCGMQVVLRTVSDHSAASMLLLPRSEQLVSMVIEILPLSLPTLLQPAILSIPHCWATSDPLHELIVVELPIDKTQKDAAFSSSSSSSTFTCYKEVDRARVVGAATTEGSSDGGVVSIEISSFGRFAVITRSLATQNKDQEKLLEELVLHVIHPTRLSSSSRARHHDQEIAVHLWLGIRRPDSTEAVHDELLRIQQQQDPQRQRHHQWTISSMALRVRVNQVLHLRIGHRISITHVWQGIVCEGNLSGCSSPLVCIRRDLQLAPHELALESQSMEAGTSSSNSNNTPTVFQVLEMNVAIHKQPNSFYSSAKRPLSNGGSDQLRGALLMEKPWRVLIPMIHDSVVMPPQPSLHQRLRTQLALAYSSDTETPSTTSTGTKPRSGGNSSDPPRVVLFEELHEMEHEFTPYFYMVEIARFSETFWQRYDRTWWFDKTKSNILLGMYKVAHAGVDPFTVIASDAFAGAIRVVQCSLDSFGSYSEPLLLEPPPPLSVIPNTATSVSVDELDDADDSTAAIPSALRRTLTLPPSLDLSLQSHASLERLRFALDTTYLASSTDFVSLFGVPRDLEAVRVHLERQRERIRATNYEVALLVLAIDRVSQRVHESVFLRSKFYKNVWKCVHLLRRLIPELDCFPAEYFAVTTALHALMRDLFEIFVKCSSPGWFARFLLDEWSELECHALFARVLRLLHQEAQQLQGSEELILFFKDAMENTSDHCVTLATEKHAVAQLLEYLLLIVGQPPAVSQSKETIQEIAAMLQMLLPLSMRKTTMITAYDWQELVAKEIASETTKRAVQQLRDKDTLASHIRSVSPAHQQRVIITAATKAPPCISIRFGLHVVRVDTQHALKVTNKTLRCTVHGQVEYLKNTKLLTFTPSLPFDKHTRYEIKLRAQYVYTALSGGSLALPATTTLTYEFATTSSL